MKIKKEIEDLLIELKRNRRQLHMYPELGLNTHQTVKLVKKLILIEPEIDDGISLIYYLKSKEPCIAFRCELDGLNIIEENKVVYKSMNHYMHACGHDMHMAILISMINYYHSNPHYPSLLFIFQPAEESGAGALHMIQKDFIHKYKVEELYGFHVLPELGDFIGCRSGCIMAESCEFKITIQGLSGHITSKGIDAIKCANKIMNEIYKLKNKIKPNLIHIGSIEGGTICNSIADTSILKGTIRSLEENSMFYIKEVLEDSIYKIDQKFKSTTNIQYSIGYPPLINNNQLVSKIKKISEDDYIEIQPLLLSEDFSYYCDYCKCCYLFCGLTTNEQLHSSTFDLKEEDCLKMLELYFRIIENV